MPGMNVRREKKKFLDWSNKGQKYQKNAMKKRPKV
jgi:hypothetical protein